MIDISEALRAARGARAEKAKRSLAEFVKQSWEVIEPVTPLVWNWHLDVICEHVQALIEGGLGKNNLIINVPPGSMKSTIISVCLPAWIWIKTPSWRGLFISGNKEVALRDSMRCRDIIESVWYREAFQPSWQLAKDQNAKGHYKNTCGGFRKAVSAKAKITGERSDDIFVDDPNDAEKSFSKVDREAIISWWNNAAANRMNNLITGKRCVIQQRLHSQDLTGHILSSESDIWEKLIIRQEYETPNKEDADFNHTTGLGWKDPRNEIGDLFFPQRFSSEVLRVEKRRLGSGYPGQHQQRPTAKEGEIFKRENWRYYTPLTSLCSLEPSERRNIYRQMEISKVIQCWDIAIGGKQDNDYTACTTLGISPTKYYILNVWAKQCEYPEAETQVQLMYDKWLPNQVFVEGGGSKEGKIILQNLKRKTRIPFGPEKMTSSDKIARAQMISPHHEAGLCYLPKGESWVNDFYESCSIFPKGAHDDDVDSFIMALEEATSGKRKLQISDEVINMFR